MRPQPRCGGCVSDASGSWEQGPTNLSPSPPADYRRRGRPVVRIGRSGSGLGVRLLIGLVDRLGEFVLVHLRAAADVQLAGDLLEVLFRRVRVDATPGLAVLTGTGG